MVSILKDTLHGTLQRISKGDLDLLSKQTDRFIKSVYQEVAFVESKSNDGRNKNQKEKPTKK